MIATHPRYHYLARRYDLSIATLEWEAGAMPAPDDLANLGRLIEETGARILIWEARPPEAAIAATDALGVASVIFDPLARPPSEGTFPAAFEAARDALAEAVERVTGD